ncbi:MAG: hypothetical protein QOG13_1589 [Sphingomonadales bacterium]|jgi:hypothetical protein|nr:hypothetical protein [Sphingomonadales bacterium]
MISTALALASAALAMQASDTTRASREAFTSCLNAFVTQAVRANKSQAEFDIQFPQACPAEQAALRAAVIRRDTAMRATRASAEDAANLEVEDSRFNFADRFAMAQPAQPRPVQQAAAAPAAQPAAQSASAQTPAQPAVQPTGQPQQ